MTSKSERRPPSRREGGSLLLLHVCCGPCAVEVVRAFEQEGRQVVPYFHNPNVHPLLEFVRRLEAFEALCEEWGLEPIVDRRYGLEEFLGTVGGRYDAPERCQACVRSRLTATAEQAKAMDIPQFGTTLLVSPYQDHEGIRAAGMEIAKEHGIEFAYRDFRPLFREGHAKAKEMGLYTQPYCGCIFSEADRYAGRLRAR